MQFNEKLNLLMKVQNITNSRLAKFLSVDPSLVSRWRTGDRKPSQKSNYEKEISEFFAVKAKKNYQKTALYEIMGLDDQKKHNDLYSLSDLLYIWLTNKKSPDKIFVENFFNNLSQNRKIDFNEPNTGENSADEIENFSAKAVKKDLEILNGIEGKRKGVIKFLQAVAAAKKTVTVLLYSSEDMKWLSSDEKFFNKWAVMLKKIISQGHKIKIIHTIKREISEMLAAIDYWMPLYLTGAVEPYYYPKYQENIFRRTMFVAPETAALHCSTVSDYSDKAQQFLYWNPEKIEVLTEEFNTFLKKCKPLMRIHSGENTYNYNQLQIEFEKQSAEMISVSDMPSFVTMPESLLKRFLDRNKADDKLKEAVLSIHKQRSRAFISNLSEHHHYEILNLPAEEDFLAKENSLKINDFFSDLNLDYSILNFCEHLNYNIQLLEKYNNYHLLLTEDFPYDNIKPAVKDMVGALISRNDEKSIIIAFKQPKITESFYLYLKYLIREIPEKEKDNLINRLNEYIDNLSKQT